MLEYTKIRPKRPLHPAGYDQSLSLLKVCPLVDRLSLQRRSFRHALLHAPRASPGQLRLHLHLRSVRAQAAERKASDARRMRLVTAQQAMSRAGGRGDAAQAIKHAEEGLAEVMDEGGLGPLAHGFNAKMASYLMDMGRHAEAKSVAARARGGMLALVGPDAEGGRVGELRALMRRIDDDEEST